MSDLPQKSPGSGDAAELEDVSALMADALFDDGGPDIHGAWQAYAAFCARKGYQTDRNAFDALIKQIEESEAVD